LQDCLAGLVDKKSYEHKGVKLMTNLAMGHHQQRSNNVHSAYTTQNKTNYIQKSPFYSSPSNNSPPVDSTSIRPIPKIQNTKLRLQIGNIHYLIPESEAKMSEITPGKVDRHKFTVFVKSNDSSPLGDKIEKVLFQLNQDYKPSLYTFINEPFELTQLAWDTFTVKIRIEFRSKYQKPPLDIDHTLVFRMGGGTTIHDIELPQI